MARKRAERGAPLDAAKVRARRRTTPVRQVWWHIRGPATAGGDILPPPSSSRITLAFRGWPSSFQAFRRSRSRHPLHCAGRTATNQGTP